MISGLFDWQNRLKQIDANGDPLKKLNEVVDWEMFRDTLEQIHIKERKSPAGRKPYDVILMFKVLILQSLYNLSDAQAEFQIRDRLSFMRFLNLNLGSYVPDEKTIWLFRENLNKAGLSKSLFKEFDAFLRDNGFAAKKGQIVDASIVRAPKQRNSREDNKKIKNGDKPEDWSKNKSRQKDTDARWVKKNGVNQFGYKNHIQIDVDNKFIRDFEVTGAATHDSNVMESILDNDNSSKDVWADSAYRSKERIENLTALGFREHIQRKGYRDKTLTEWEKRGNHTRSKTRSRVEHIFGVQAQRAGNLLIRTVGVLRATVKIGFRNLAYNIDRYAMLVR